jgi:hypothetical protein
MRQLGLLSDAGWVEVAVREDGGSSVTFTAAGQACALDGSASRMLRGQSSALLERHRVSGGLDPLPTSTRLLLERNRPITPPTALCQSQVGQQQHEIMRFMQ